MAASTSGLCAEGKPLAGGARLQEGWAVGGLVRNQPPAETKSEPKLVEVPCGASADAGSIPAASTSVAGSADGGYRIDDYRNVQRRRTLPRRRSRMPAGVAPHVDDQVTEAVHDLRV